MRREKGAQFVNIAQKQMRKFGEDGEPWGKTAIAPAAWNAGRARRCSLPGMRGTKKRLQSAARFCILYMITMGQG